MALSDNERREVWARFMETETGKFGDFTKHDLLAAVVALDDALDKDPSHELKKLREACPEPARGELTNEQLARLGAMLDYRKNPPPPPEPLPDPRIAALAGVAIKHLGMKDEAAAEFSEAFLKALEGQV